MLTEQHLDQPFPHTIVQNFIPNFSVSNQLLSEVNNIRGALVDPMPNRIMVNLNRHFAKDQGQYSLMIKMVNYFTRSWAKEQDLKAYSYLNYMITQEHDLMLTLYSKGADFPLHIDPATLTVIYTIWKNPHDPGGYIEFPDYDYQPIMGPNQIIIFPSWVPWRIEAVHKDQDLARIDVIQLVRPPRGDF